MVARVFGAALGALLLSALLGGQVAQAVGSGFVARSSSVLVDGTGAPMRFAGSNMYWLGLSEDGGVHYPTHTEIDNAMAETQQMGANVVRSHMMLSVGCGLCIEPSLGVFNNGSGGRPDAMESVDYAVYSAKQHQIHLMLTLVDNYNFFAGGKFTYEGWRGLTDSNGSNFFTNATLLADFEHHIDYVLNHVNRYTGVALKDEPAIMAWETGNELATDCTDGWHYSGWTDAVARHIKSIDVHHLVADGHYGIYTGCNNTIDAASLSLSSVDMVSNHAYDDYRSPATVVWESQQAAAYNKVYFLGEYDWTQNPSHTWTLTQMLSAVESTPTFAGDLYWELLCNNLADPTCIHNDGHADYYPGTTSDMQTRDGQLRNHAFALCPAGASCRGIVTPPATHPPTAPPTAQPTAYPSPTAPPTTRPTAPPTAHSSPTVMPAPIATNNPSRTPPPSSNPKPGGSKSTTAPGQPEHHSPANPEAKHPASSPLASVLAAFKKNEPGFAAFMIGMAIVALAFLVSAGSRLYSALAGWRRRDIR